MGKLRMTDNMIKLAATLPLLIALFTSSAVSAAQPPSFSVSHLSRAQKEALVMAYRAGNQYGLGLPFAAVVFQESSACANAVESSKGAYGCAQVREIAARAVAGVAVPVWDLANPDLQDENMAIGARYLDLCMRRMGWPAGIGCYYVGLSAAVKMGKRRLDRLPYTREVLAKMRKLRNLPESLD